MSGTYKHDMTMMFVIHDALRRELDQVARIAARTTDDPRTLLRTAAGWEMFKSYLHVHHGAEDEALWPAVRAALAGRPDDLAVVDAMEAEHATIDPLLDAVDAALADDNGGAERLGDLVDALVTGLNAHLKHEEDAGLPLFDDVATPQLLMAFGQAHTKRIGPDSPRYLPWLLDGASEAASESVLRVLPEPAREAYRNAWVPAYAASDRWGVG
ncbi:hemerythrin domain-containing protein [Streptomyces sp. NPDC002054]|uniref:hemerythrin domain-containing protein n=1 Tax=Streptomyces sp. NPDC002054 TaxID=3154663 RepID=UPI003328DEBC